MYELLHALHGVLRWTHIVLGFAGLLTFWLIALGRKGTRTHVRLGRAFTWTTYIVGGSAVVGAAWAVLHLDSYFPSLAHAPDEEQLLFRELFPFFFAILFYLGLATLAGAVFGVRLMRYGPGHERLRRSSVPFWVAASAVAAAGLVVFGAWRLAFPHPSGKLPWAAYQVPLWVGALGLWSAVHDLRYVFGPAPGGKEWYFRHVEQMFGVGVAFHTAFAVFGSTRLFGFQWSGPWALAPWIAPVVIGVSCTQWYVRKLRRSMESRPEGSRVNSPRLPSENGAPSTATLTHDSL